MGKMRGGMVGLLPVAVWWSFPTARVPEGPPVLKTLQLVHRSQVITIFAAFGTYILSIQTIPLYSGHSHKKDICPFFYSYHARKRICPSRSPGSPAWASVPSSWIAFPIGMSSASTSTPAMPSPWRTRSRA